ncbi:tetratricopeptide repeat protein [Ancylomarina longa]|uniref:Uncharacterized protein n=1 Tax=Ancylomarina longa TaxID=2487017 RepID=A0A434AWG9_9BACT|nr:tetratricopeptide repeat protein [Ancylomarina longa]RUT78836.1 hypothetical protein DLK05_06815 [Ancylomarina longa]
MKLGIKFGIAFVVGSLVLSVGSLRANTLLSASNKDKKQKEISLTEQQKLQFDFAFTEANKAVLLGDLDKGISLYASCLKVDPSSAVVRYELANIYMSQENYDSALELARGAVSLQAQNIWYQIQLANIYQKKGMIDQACDVYNELIERNPDRNDFYYLQASLYASVEKFAEAVEVYNRLEKKLGIMEGVSLEKERLYLKMGKKNLAYAELQKLIKKFPFRADFYGMLADLYLSDNQEDKAFKQYQEILKIDPDNGLVHFYLADFYRKKGELEKSNEALAKAFAQPDVAADQKIQYLLALLMNPDQAKLEDNYLRGLLETLEKVYPENVRVHALYADFLRKRKDSKGARQQLRKVLEVDKSNYIVWEELLLIDNELLDFEDMYAVSSEAIKYFPAQPALYIFKGVSAAQKSDFKTAITTFEKGLVYIGENVQMRIQFQTYLGDAYYQMGNAEKAFKAYDDVLLFDPQNVIVLNNYSYYLSVRKERLQEAEKMSSQCVALAAENSTYLDTHAWVLYQLGKFQEARQFMEKALENGGGESAVIVEHYGDILFRLGEKDNALIEWKKALDIGDGSKLLSEKIKSGTIPEENVRDEE